MTTRLFWDAPSGRVYGHIIDRHPHGEKVLFTVLWSDGRRGRFIEGSEPDELKVAGPNSSTEAR